MTLWSFLHYVNCDNSTNINYEWIKWRCNEHWESLWLTHWNECRMGTVCMAYIYAVVVVFYFLSHLLAARLPRTSSFVHLLSIVILLFVLNWLQCLLVLGRYIVHFSVRLPLSRTHTLRLSFGVHFVVIQKYSISQGNPDTTQIEYDKMNLNDFNRMQMFTKYFDWNSFSAIV